MPSTQPNAVLHVCCMQAAGGSSTDGQGSILDQVVSGCEARTKISMGSSQLVEQSLPAMQAV